MCCRATFAMEVSSTSMKVASITETAMSQGLKLGVHEAVLAPLFAKRAGDEPRASLTALSPPVRQTYRAPAGVLYPGARQRRSLPAHVVLPLRSCQWRSQEATN